MKCLTAVVVMVGVLLACSVPAGAVASPSADKICKGLPGKPWKDLYGKTGTKYDVTVRGVTCAFVKPWIPKLSGVHKPTQILRGGPPGWRCIAQGGAKALGVTCYKGDGRSPSRTYFYANPSGGSNTG